jgi:hypothetical protein
MRRAPRGALLIWWAAGLLLAGVGPGRALTVLAPPRRRAADGSCHGLTVKLELPMAQLVELGGIVSGAVGLGPGRQDLPLELT